MGQDNYHRKPKNKWTRPRTNDRRDNKRRKTEKSTEGEGERKETRWVFIDDIFYLFMVNLVCF